MVHIIILLKRKPGMSKIEFHRHWRDVHSQFFVKVPGARRYIQSHFFLRKSEVEPLYDGTADIWVDSETAFQGVFSHPTYLEGAYADLPNFLVREQLIRLLTEDHVLLKESSPHKDLSLIKAVFFLKRKPGMEIEEFRRYWEEVHGPIALRLPGLRRYIQCHVLPSAYAHGEPLYDGVSHLWFDNRNAVREAFNSIVSWVDLRPSAARFIDQSLLVGLVAEEFRVIWTED